MLARRPLTVAEVRTRLAAKQFDDTAIELAVDELLDEALLDDADLAYQYIVVRAERMLHGEQRLVRDLVARGVENATAEAAWRRALEEGEVDDEALLRRAVERRLSRERQFDDGARRRVYNALLRAGFAPSEIGAELRRQTDGTTQDESP